MASEGYHEPTDQLSAEVVDRHRAIVSIMEELEAIDWYDQRVSATANADLAAVLAHNRDEEKEHAAMTIEWLRRNDPVFDRHLRTYLFTTAPITEVEEVAQHGGGESRSDAPAGGEPAAAETSAGSSSSVGSLRPDSSGEQSR